MSTVAISAIHASEQERQHLRDMASSAPDGPVRQALTALQDMFDSGEPTITICAPDSDMTPNQAATLLGMSRTHLYKLLDNGTIPCHNVGRDRRIRFCDIAEFRQKREEERAKMARRISNTRRVEQDCIDQIILMGRQS